MIKPIISLTIAAFVMLGGCGTYKMEIQQGNYITQQELARVQRGMTAEQVRAILGTPLLQDNFHKDRWDYTFYLKARDGSIQRSNVTVLFQHNVVSDIRTAS
ncbi:MAG: outer membrane protein assembly factor BamE [Thiothrix sp.]